MSDPQQPLENSAASEQPAPAQTGDPAATTQPTGDGGGLQAGDQSDAVAGDEQ